MTEQPFRRREGMDMTDALQEAKAICGRFTLGERRASPRALRELGPQGVVGILRRYAAGDWPGYEPEEVERELGRQHCPGVWPVHSATYQVNGEAYTALTEHSFTYGSTVTQVCHQDELFEDLTSA